MREAAHLRQRYRAIWAYVGLISGFVGLILLVPVVVVPAGPSGERWLLSFVLPGLALSLLGFTTWKRLHPGQAVLTLQEGGVIVLLSWVVASLAGAVPFVVAQHLSTTQAIFESVSGWTTTGLSVVDVANASAPILLWRSTMQLAGGAGLAIIMLAAITGPGGGTLSVAEGRSDQLVPHVRSSAHLVLRIYAGYVVFGILGLRVAGMGWFDAVNHAFCAVSTGGFSTRTDSIGHWDSAPIEAVTIVLMLLGNFNFVTAWCVLRCKFRTFARNGEVRLQAVVIPVFAGLLLWSTCVPLYASASKAIRVAVFETVSALTTTGYSTVGYGAWGASGVLLLIVLMLIGGGTCSTAGALKQQRVYLLFRALSTEMRRPFLPRTTVVDDAAWIGEERAAITDAQLRTVATFVFLYMATWFAGTAVLTACGYGIAESMFEFASAVGTVGLSVGVTAPDAPGLVLWSETVGMFLGRLEFFVIFASAAKLARDAYVALRPRPEENLSP